MDPARSSAADFWLTAGSAQARAELALVEAERDRLRQIGDLMQSEASRLAKWAEDDDKRMPYEVFQRVGGVDMPNISQPVEMFEKSAISRRLMWEVHSQHDGATGYYAPATDVLDLIDELVGQYEAGAGVGLTLRRLDELVVGAGSSQGDGGNAQ